MSNPSANVHYYKGEWGTRRCSHGHSYCKPCNFGGATSLKTVVKDDSILGSTPLAPKAPLIYNNEPYFMDLYCGQCGVAAKHHPVYLSDRVTCSRNYADWTVVTWGDTPDFYLDGYAAEDFSGQGIEDVVTDDYFDWTPEFDTIDSWRDTHPDEQTSAVAGWYVSKSGVKTTWAYTENHKQFHGNLPTDFSADRTTYVEGFEGFYSTQILDFATTEKYNKNLFNVFTRAKSGKLQVGSIEISYDDPFDTGDKWVTARCISPECSNAASITLPLHDPTVSLEYKQNFVWACVVHGNMHAISWIRDKTVNPIKVPSIDSTEFDRTLIGYRETTVIEKDYHDDQTDREYIIDVPVYQYTPKHVRPNVLPLFAKEYDRKTHYELNYTLTPKDDESPQGFIQTLFDHNSKCTNSECSCSDLLKSEVPALKESA